MTGTDRVSPSTTPARRRITRALAFGLAVGVGFVLANTGVSRALAEGPSLTLSPDHAAVGATVVVAGDGWPDGPVQIHLAPDVSCGSATLVGQGSATGGAIQIPVRVPTGLKVRSTYVVTACAGKTYVTAPLLVDPPPPAIVISPAHPRPGADLRVSGQHWVPSLGAVSLYLPRATTPSATASVREDGTFAATVATTGLNAGTYQLTACQDCGDPKGFPRAGGTFTLVSTTPVQPPSFQLQPALAAPGQSVSVTGAHWLTGTGPMRIFASKADSADPAAALGSFLVGPRGMLSGSFPVPEIVAGQHRLYACQRCGSSRAVSARATLTIITTPPVNPAVAAEPAHGRPGQTTWVSGSGWRPSGGPVSVFVTLAESSDPTRSVTSVAVGADGTFRVPLQVPDRTSGHYAFVVCQGCGTAGDRLRATLDFTIDRPARGLVAYVLPAAALMALAAAGLVGHRLRRRPPGTDRDPGRRDNGPRPSPVHPRFVPQPDGDLDVVTLPPTRVPVTLRLRPQPDRTEPDVDVEVLT